EDDDPVLHAKLRAETRLGRPSVQIVCLERREGRLYGGDGEPTPLDLEQEPDRALTARLVRRSIGVSNQRVVHELLASSEAAAKSWSSSPLLRYRRLVAFEDGEATVAGVIFTFYPDLGLRIDTGKKP